MTRTIETEYGVLEGSKIDVYLAKLLGRVYKILPMKEEKCQTLDSYADSLVREIIGNSNIFLGDELLSISGTLKGLNFDNHKQLRSDIFKVMGLIEKVKERVK